MTTARTARPDDAALVVDIAARGFYEDPVMSWVFPDRTARLAQLQVTFAGLVSGFLAGTGTVHLLDDACTSLWRAPSYDYTPAEAGAPSNPPEFSADVLERLALLGSTMTAAHPHSPHWYLNVLSTVPERQGQGLGARTLDPVLATCDSERVPAYLESSNPRNIPFYQRQGFVLIGEIVVAGGPSLFPMWRDPKIG